jgi:hypothetical protein
MKDVGKRGHSKEEIQEVFDMLGLSTDEDRCRYLSFGLLLEVDAEKPAPIGLSRNSSVRTDGEADNAQLE